MVCERGKREEMEGRNQRIGIFFLFLRLSNFKQRRIMIDELLSFNRSFVESKGYEKYITDKYPDKKIAIVTCMDTRLTELLPAALGIRNGDVKMIKNAGGTINHPFGSAMRSLLVAIYELGVKEVMIIGHTDCGVQHMDSELMLKHMQERGESETPSPCSGRYNSQGIHHGFGDRGTDGNKGRIDISLVNTKSDKRKKERSLSDRNQARKM